jgi:hypothetical protein
MIHILLLQNLHEQKFHFSQIQYVSAFYKAIIRGKIHTLDKMQVTYIFNLII